MRKSRQHFWSEFEGFLRGPTISAKLVEASDRGLPALNAITFDIEARFGLNALAPTWLPTTNGLFSAPCFVRPRLRDRRHRRGPRW